MHTDELDIDDALVGQLVRDQFPDWAALPLTRIEPWGTVHAIYRLGDGLAVRLPRHPAWSHEERLVAHWLPRFAPVLPLTIPVPIAAGRPADRYPCHWSVCTWVEGDSAADTLWEPLTAADALAAFVAALRGVDPADGPPRRDRLTRRGDDMRARVARLGAQAIEVWEAGLAAPPWEGPPVWCHADLDARNWVVRAGRIAGVIDWDSFGVGDPAADVMVAWKLHSAEATAIFRKAIDVDDATWTRARAWAVAQAAMALSHYTAETNATLVHEAERWLELALDSE